MIGDDDRRLVEQLDELFCPSHGQAILCSTVPNNNNEALTPDTQGLAIH